MDPSKESSLYHNIYALEELQKTYATFKDVEENRKLCIDREKNESSVSSGYNTGMSWIIQFIARTSCNFYGYDCTSLGLKHFLEQKHQDSDACIKRIVEFASKHIHDTDFINETVAALTTFEKTVSVAGEVLFTVARTYECEGDRVSSDLINVEAKKLEQMSCYIVENTTRLSSPISLFESSESDTDSVQNISSPKLEEKDLSSPNKVLPKDAAALEESKKLLADFKKMIEWLPSTETSKVKDNISTFLLKCTFQEVKQIQAIRDQKLDEIPVGSRIEISLNAWQEYLNTPAFDTTLKAGFQLALQKVINEKKESLARPSDAEKNNSRTMMNELRAKFKDKTPAEVSE